MDVEQVLAAALAERGSDGDGPLLDSYDRERRPAARRLLALTHLVFWARPPPG
jgi:2-polyprenyl-6-methoxyphenol hydroxylase-like FAD-dependent oxidoreductase